MPTVDENLVLWEDSATWGARGDDWSTAWGSAEAQWHGCLRPRLHPHLPASTILEIGPGHGRWTQFLLSECDRLIGVDLSPACTAACQQRFAEVDKAEFHSNGGRSLDVVASNSIDLVFSFDSLVHAELDVLSAYLLEIADKLSPSGLAFLHHSNLGAYRTQFERFERIPPAIRSRLITHGIIDHTHLRAPTVTATAVADACTSAGMQCIGQEIINWGSKRLIDCISMITRRGSPLARPNCVVRNSYFMAEAESIRRASQANGAANSLRGCR